RTAHLDALRGTLVEEFVGHTQETDLGVPVRRDDWWYIVRTTAGNDYPMFTRIADAGTLPQVEPGVMLEGEQVLLDAQAEAAGREFYSPGGLPPPPDPTLYASAREPAGDGGCRRWTPRAMSGSRCGSPISPPGRSSTRR